jgi:hypothetical protein
MYHIFLGKYSYLNFEGNTRYRSWLKYEYYAARPEGRGVDSRLGYCFFFSSPSSLPNLSNRTTAQGLTQPLTERGTRNLPENK